MSEPRSVPCLVCGQELSNDLIALNIKLSGLGSPCLRCIQCLAVDMDILAEELQALIAYFHETGCEIFRRNYLA